MALSLATLVPAKIGTSEIATKSNITSAISAYDPAGVINSRTTTIDGGKITTGSITAGQIAAGSIVASNIASNTIDASKIAAGTITANNISTGTITADKLNISTLSSISANIGTITAGSITAGLITAGTLNVARLPGLSIQNLIHYSTAVALPENSATQSSWPISASTATPTTYQVCGSITHNKTANTYVKLNYMVLLQNNASGSGTTGSGWLWVRISRSGTVLFNSAVGWAQAFVVGGSAPATTVPSAPLTGFFVDTTAGIDTYTYTIELAICCQISNQIDVYVPYSVDFESFQVMV